MIKSYKLTELADLIGVTRDTIKRHPEQFVPIQVSTYETKRSERGYGIRYVSTEDFLHFVFNGDVGSNGKYKNKNKKNLLLQEGGA